MTNQNQGIPDGFIYVPKLNLWFAKEKSLHKKTWLECIKELQKQNTRMPTIYEFVEFLKFLKNDYKQINKQEAEQIFKDITEPRAQWRSEWLDADFKMHDKKLYLHYNHGYNTDNKLVYAERSLENIDFLNENKTPGISLDDWIENHNETGLPLTKIKSGDLYYFQPGTDNDSVARFGAYSAWANLDCSRNSSPRGSHLGVRPVYNIQIRGLK